MYECHITIAPVFGDERESVGRSAARWNFKLAKLFMMKEGPDEESRRDTFMTGHERNYDALRYNMEGLISELRSKGFEVLRAKIEDIVFDTRYGDEMP